MEEQHAVELRRDVDTVASAVARLHRDLDMRFDGVRSDFEVALLEEHVKMVHRFERLEALVAERLGENIVEALKHELAAEA